MSVWYEARDGGTEVSIGKMTQIEEQLTRNKPFSNAGSLTTLQSSNNALY